MKTLLRLFGSNFLKSHSKLLVFLISILIPFFAAGQVTGDYRSAQNGNWSDLSTWEYYDGTSWITPTAGIGYPGELTGSGFVTIRDGHTIPLNVSPPEPIEGLLIIGVDSGNRSTLQMGTANRTLRTSYLFLSDFGQVFWAGNSRLFIDEDAVIITQNGGGFFPVDSNNAMRLYRGDEWYAAGQATATSKCTFEQVNSADGILSDENFGLTSNSPIFVGQTLNLEVEIDNEDVIDFYTWSGVGPGGYSFGPIETTNPEQDVDNITEAGTYTFTVIVELECGFGLDEIEVIVLEAPEVNCNAVDIGPLCVDDDPVTLTGATPEGGEYSGPGVSLSNGDYIFDPIIAGADDHTITYTLGSSSCTFTITVNDLPLMTCPDDIDDVCIDDAPFTLTGATPAGGAYSGAGVSESGGVYTFTPADAGADDHTITYTYTDTNGCTNSCTFTITVNDLPEVTASSNSPVLVGETIALTGGPNGMVSYSWTGPDGFTSTDQSPTIDNATLNMAGTYTLVVQDSNQCENTASIDVMVFTDDPVPVPVRSWALFIAAALMVVFVVIRFRSSYV